METKILSNGVKMPMVGYGTLNIPIENTKECVLNALNTGYRLIDTAAAYFNEKEIGEAIKISNIDRNDLFITSKVWIQDAGYESTIKAFQNSLDCLGLDYLDLYLIHQPYGDYYGSYRAMEDLYKQGRIRAIGVCNFNRERFVDLYMNCSIKPMINQIEYHPFFLQTNTKQLLETYDCILEAWGPFNEGQRDIFHNQRLIEIAKSHKKSVAQIILRWHLQQGIVAIPKTIHIERMKENLDIWDFQLSKEEMDAINVLNIGHSEIIDHQCVCTVKALNNFKIHD